MNRATGVVEEGRIILPDTVRLPEGAQVLVEWDQEHPEVGPPIEREPWTADEIQREIEWARTWKPRA